MMNHGTIWIAGGFRPAIFKQGPKWTQVVHIDGSRVKVTKTKESLRCTPIEGYTLQKLARKLLASRNCLGVKMHVTKTARKLLNEAKQKD